VIAYALTWYADSVFELVVNASALGTAGMFVAVMFGLFTPFGRQFAALAAILCGTGLYFYATFLTGDQGLFGGFYTPAVVAALATYVVVALIEHGVCRVPLYRRATGTEA
jgi:hypothetical protein